MGTIDRILSIIEDYVSFHVVEIIDPFLITVTTNPQNVMQITTDKNRVYYIGIEVRNLGTATYVAVGTPGHIESRLIAKNSYIEYAAPERAYIDANTLMIVSDSNDAIVEITGVYL